MTKLIIVALLVLAAIVLAVWALILKGKEDMLQKKEASLEDRNGRLSRENDMLIADREALRKKNWDMSQLFNSANEIFASYTVTDSDEMKYDTSSRAFIATVKNRIALTIVHDILRKYEPIIDEVNGKTRYSYKFKVVEDK